MTRGGLGAALCAAAALCAPAAGDAGMAWLDLVPDSPGCVRAVFRFRRTADEHGSCRLGTAEWLPQPDAAGAQADRPYYKDAQVAHSVWMGSNTTVLCHPELDARAGWSPVVCTVTHPWTGAADTLRYSVSWWPLHLLLHPHGVTTHASVSGYMVAWLKLPAGSLAEGAAVEATVPVLDTRTAGHGFAIDDAAVVSACVRTEAGATLCEKFAPQGGGRRGYGKHGATHNAWRRDGGLALYYPSPHREPLSAHEELRRKKEREGHEEDLWTQMEGGPPTIAQRVRRMARYVSRMRED